MAREEIEEKGETEEKGRTGEIGGKEMIAPREDKEDIEMIEMTKNNEDRIEITKIDMRGEIGLDTKGVKEMSKETTDLLEERRDNVMVMIEIKGEFTDKVSFVSI